MMAKEDRFIPEVEILIGDGLSGSFLEVDYRRAGYFYFCIHGIIGLALILHRLRSRWTRWVLDPMLRSFSKGDLLRLIRIHVDRLGLLNLKFGHSLWATIREL